MSKPSSDWRMEIPKRQKRGRVWAIACICAACVISVSAFLEAEIGGGTAFFAQVAEAPKNEPIEVHIAKVEDAEETTDPTLETVQLKTETTNEGGSRVVFVPIVIPDGDEEAQEQEGTVYAYDTTTVETDTALIADNPLPHALVITGEEKEEELKQLRVTLRKCLRLQKRLPELDCSDVQEQVEQLQKEIEEEKKE